VWLRFTDRYGVHRKEVAMRVLGYSWAGVRSTNLKSTVSFFRDTLGLSLIEQRENLAQFEMPSGQ